MDAISWKGNKLRSERRVFAGAFLGIALALAAYVALVIRGFFGNDDLFCLVLAEILLGGLVILGAGFLMLAARTPSEVGTGPAGIGFRRNLLLEPESTELIRWEDISNIEDHYGVGGNGLVVVKKDGARRQFEVDPFLQTEVVGLAWSWMQGEEPSQVPGPEAPGGLLEQAKELAAAWSPQAAAAATGNATSAAERDPAAVPEGPAPVLPVPILLAPTLTAPSRPAPTDPAPSHPARTVLAPSHPPSGFPAPSVNAPATPAIRWQRGDARWVIVAILLAFFALTEMLAYAVGGWFPNVNPACYILGLLAWPVLIWLILKMNPPRPIGLSDAGIHVRTASSLVLREELVPWEEVVKVRPADSFDIRVSCKSGRMVEAGLAGRAAMDEINLALEARYDRLRGRARRADPADNRTGGMENRPHGWLYARIALCMAFGAGFLGALLAWFLGIYPLDRPDLALTTAGVVAGFGGLLKSLGDLRAVPESVAISTVGIYIRYKGRLPPGTTDFAAWADIASLDPPAKGDPEMNASRAVVLVKKSGASYFLGPLDPAIVTELKSRAASILK